MALNTAKDYRNKVMYSVFVRDYSEEGNFEGVTKDLDRIRDLGVDIIWLMPIHPIGEKNRKGSMGSPYAISDYRAINPDFGTEEDLKNLVNEAHARGMKVIIDVVYNHTSPDSWLAKNHPEWFYRKEDGSMGNRVGDWTDVVDLDYGNTDLWDYQIDTLKHWAGIVDGFRCDVAPMVPLDFWLKAREEVEKVHPGCFWLSESVEGPFVVELRAHDVPALSDSEIYQAFDAAYDYDIFHMFQDAVAGKVPFSRYAEAVNQQEWTYPDNYVKLRYLENHDQMRAAQIIPDRASLENLTAFLFFQKGLTLVYAGQEMADPHWPSLFEIEPVNWNTGVDLSPLMRRLAEVKRDPLFTDCTYELRAFPGDILVARRQHKNRVMVGVFSARALPGSVPVDVPDGTYKDLLDGHDVEVRDGALACNGKPVIIEAQTSFSQTSELPE